MEKKAFQKILWTKDLIIRSALVERLENGHSRDKKVRIIQELGVSHGTARIDVAVVNGIMHGFEIKSDYDTLHRLPEQMNTFNAVFDKMTLVVGKNHLFDAVSMVPDWWEIWVAKIDTNNSIVFNIIREGERNKKMDRISVARLLWREEAIRILEEAGEARGLYSKSRDCLYEKLSNVFTQESLCKKVRETIFFRSEWRPDSPLVTNGG